MKKILFIIVILSSLTNTIMATNDETKLIVWAKDGTKVTYVLNEKPLVTFTETDLVIHSNGIEMNYPLTSMARFTYEKGQNTGVRNINSIESHISFDGNLLCFHNLSMNSNVSLYSWIFNLTPAIASILEDFSCSRLFILSSIEERFNLTVVSSPI